MAEDKKRLLVVEDDTFLRDLLAQRLNKETYEVLYAVDGEAALETLRDKKPQLILLDILLPGLNGFDILEKIRADKNLSDIKVLILSNLDQPSDRKRGEELGAIDYIIKSNSTIEEIVARVREHLA